MKEENFCRCCLSEECYKDMANDYYIGNRTENYFEMFVNVFSINISKQDDHRCLICEECVSKLRDSAAFKKQVLNVQETIKNKLCGNYNSADTDTNIDLKIENDDFDDFEDAISDRFNDSDFMWENTTTGSSQKGQLLVIELESKEPKNVLKTKQLNSTKNTNATTPKLNAIAPRLDGKIFYTRNISNTKKTKVAGNTKKPSPKKNYNPKASTTIDKQTEDNAEKCDNLKDFDVENDINFDASNDWVEIDNNDGDFSPTNSEEDFFRNDSKRDDTIGTMETQAKRKAVKTKATAKRNKESAKGKKQEKTTQPHLYEKLKQNTRNLILNSNLCLFRSLQNKYGCIICRSKFLNIIQLREHLLTHSNKVLALNIMRLRGRSYKNADISDLKCNRCSDNCTDLSELMNHLKKEHEFSFHGTEHVLVPYKLQNGFQCLMCDSKFNSYLKLSIHMNSHYQNNVCEICGLSYINRLGLRAHVNSMHKEKKCTHCPAVLVSLAAKVKHMRQVHNIRHWKRHCNLCGKTFRYTHMLNEHKIQEHGEKRQIFNCTQCDKTFLNKGNFQLHMRGVHIKERNHPCPKCDMRFFTKYDRIRHERTHEEIRSFTCNNCDGKFKTKDSWRRHVKRQHGDVFDLKL